MSDSYLLIYAVVALGMFMIGMAKGGGWASMAALSVPMVGLVLPIDDVVGMMLPVLMLADILAIGAHWRKWNGRLLWLMIPPSIAGVTIGTLFLTSAPVRLIRIVIGLIVLAFAFYKLFEKSIFSRLTYTPRNWHGALAGLVAGFTSSIAHTGGPPIAIYLLMQNLQPRVFAATLAFFFLILNYIKVPFYYFGGVFNFGLLQQFLWLLPAVPLGVWSGKWLVVRVSKETFDRIILALLIMTSFLLIFT